MLARHAPLLAGLPIRLIALLVGAVLVLSGVLNGNALTVSGAGWLLFGVLLLVAGVSRLNRTAIFGLGYAIALVAFTNLRFMADDIGFPIHYQYPLAADRLLFLGVYPSEWLQENVYNGRIGPLEALLGAVYMTHFLNTHATALLLLTTRTALLPRFVSAFALMLAAGLVIHILLPTAPPWLESEGVHRIVGDVFARIYGGTYDESASSLDENLFAAMPSLHVGFATLVALVLAQYGRLHKGIGIAYVAAMCFSLTYLGEHYVIDSIAGVALALGCWRLVQHQPRLIRTRVRTSPVPAFPASPTRSA